MKLALCAATAGLAMASAAHAEVSVNAGVTSEYLFRGLSQGSYAAGFGGADWSGDGGVYLGTWASTVGFGPSAEVDLYGGWKTMAGGANLDFGAIYYGYLNDPNTYINYKTRAADSSITAAS
ncbi:MAG: TorF family putative porin, partial [Alphaproteobacteria bacterium]